MSTQQHDHILSLVRRMIPPLSPELHKGQAGRVGVLGGSGDYSGAPFFAAMGAMRFGADLAHVICEPGAGAVIKTYSPDLIVHGVLDEKTDTPSLDTARREMSSIMERLHVLIIGPGLGRSAYMQSCARAALELARSLDIGVVVDADGLWLLNSEPGLVKGLEGRIVLTPNVMEFKRLATAVGMTDSEPEKHCANLARKLGHNIVIIQKGADDIISHGALVPDFISVQSSDTLVDSIQGGLKRVGGQGDILSGTTGTLLAWGREWARGAYAHLGDEYAPDDQLTPHVALLAAYGASAFNRTVSRRGFEAKGRSMVTHDLVNLVGPVYEDMFGDKSKGKGRL